MTMLYHQRRPLPAADEQALGARFAPLHELMAQSDYIVVQLPLERLDARHHRRARRWRTPSPARS